MMWPKICFPAVTGLFYVTFGNSFSRSVLLLPYLYTRGQSCLSPQEPAMLNSSDVFRIVGRRDWSPAEGSQIVG